MSFPKLTVTCLGRREGRVGSEKRRRLPSERVVKLEEGTVSRVRIHEKHGVEKTLAQELRGRPVRDEQNLAGARVLLRVPQRLLVLIQRVRRFDDRADGTVLDEFRELAVHSLEPLPWCVSNPVENVEPAKRDAPVNEVRQRHRGGLSRGGRKGNHRAAIFHRGHELSHLAGVPGPLEQHTQAATAQRLRNTFLEAIAIEYDEAGAKLSHLVGRVLAAN